MYQVKKMSLPERYGVGRPRIYPFHECKVGEGFDVEKDKIMSVRACLQFWLKTEGDGQKWITRRIASGAYGVMRVE